MRKVRDLERTREAILKAGLAEFAAKGLAGARTDAIARRAGMNKRMLFYCFGSKQGLYREVLKRKLEEKERVIESLPDDIVDGLLQMYDAGCADVDWVRMLEWEALASGNRAAIGEEDRRKLFETALNRLRKADGQGAVVRGADLSHLFISLLAVSFFPLAFPQMTRLVTGMAPTDPDFKASHREFLRWLGERLRGDGREAQGAEHDTKPEAASTRPAKPATAGG
jgi:AcrR family transcriptional regulator